MPTAEEVYAAARALPPPERLRLVALILDELAQTLPPALPPEDILKEGTEKPDASSQQIGMV